MHPVFWPLQFLVKLLDRFSYRWKFASVAVVLCAAGAVFLWQVIDDYRTQLSATEREIAALDLAGQAYELLVNVQLQRGISYAAQMGSPAFAARLADQSSAVRKCVEQIDQSVMHSATFAAMRPRWEQLRAELERASETMDGRSTAKGSFITHTSAIESLLSWMIDIGDFSGLMSNNQPALYHLNVAQILTLPRFVERIADLRGFASGNFLTGSGGGSMELELTTRVAALDIAEDALHRRIERIAAILPEALHMHSDAVRDLHNTVRYLKNTARFNAINTTTEADAIDFFDIATAAIDRSTQIYRTQLRPRSLALIETRQAEARSKLQSQIAGSVGVFVLIATLFAAMYLSIRGSVRALTNASARFAKGEFAARVSIQSHDELRQVGEQFNRMADDITDLVEMQRAQTKQLADLLQNNPSVVFSLDPLHLHCTFLSPNAGSVLGPACDVPDADLECWTRIVRADQRDALRQAVTSWRDGGFQGVLRSAYPLADESLGIRWIEIQFSPVLDDHDRVIEVVGACTDITERQHAKTRLELAASVFSSAREGIIITDATGSIVEVNDAFSKITGWSRAEIIGKNPRVFQSGRQDADFYDKMWATLKREGYWEGEVWNRHKSGRTFAQTLSIAAVGNPNGQVLHYVALISDITLQKENEQRLRHLAHFDPLTGLPNRTLLADRLQQALAQSQRSGKLVAVALIDLDGFKAVNDEHGHDAGDTLLLTVSKRMRECLRTEDTVARLGGDEFVVVMGALDDREGIERPITRLLAAINTPVEVENATVTVSGSIGVSLYSQAATIEPDQLLRQADQAMYAAKQAGKNRYRVFDDNLTDQTC